MSLCISEVRKGGHRYYILCDEPGLDRALQVVAKWARDEELNFGWFEAAVIAARMRGMMAEEKCEGK